MAKNGKRRWKQQETWTAWQKATLDSPRPDSMEKTRTTWLNSRYQVERHDFPNGITYLSMKRLHKQAIHDWRELLRIKNELTHPMREGIELYPLMIRIQDTSNQFHMFVMPLGCAINLGFADRHVEDSSPDEFKYGRARQRKLPAWMTPWRKSQESVTTPSFLMRRCGEIRVVKPANRRRNMSNEISTLPTVIWHSDQKWGTESFRIEGKLYRWAKPRESAKVLKVITRYGVVRLTPLNRKELHLLSFRRLRWNGGCHRVIVPVTVQRGPQRPPTARYLD